MDSLILTLLIFIPVIGAILMLPVANLYGKENSHYYKWIALVATGVQFILTCVLYLKFDPTQTITNSPFTVQVDWISHFNIQYFLGVDGLSMPMVLLTGLLSLFVSYQAGKLIDSLWGIFLYSSF